MEIKTVPLSQIKPAKYNPRKDLKPGDPEYDKLKKIINEFDLVEPLVINKRNNILVGGHQRLKILKANGVQKVKVSIVDLDDHREKALNIALNNPNAQGEWDFPKLKDLIIDIDDGSIPDLEITGFDELEIKDIFDYDGEEGKFRKGEGHVRNRVEEWKTKENALDISDEYKKKYSHIKNVIIQFSGGKDSTGALLWASKNFSDRRVIAVFSDPGVEFPGITAHLQDVCEYASVELVIVKPEKDWWTWIKEKGWPSIIYLPCRSTFIDNVCDNFYKKFSAEDTLLIDGSRAEESTRGRKKSFLDFHSFL